MSTDPAAAEPTASAVHESQLAGGENKHVEFKSSIRWDRELKTVNRDLSKVVAKTIAGFMNADGGTLYIGVDDDGGVLGIEADIASLSTQSIDGFERAAHQALSNHLGADVSPRVDLTFPEVDGKQICVVHCPPHSGAVFFRDGDRQEFYVREGNRTVPLKMAEAQQYIGSQWPPVGQTESIREMAEILERLDARLATERANAGSKSSTPWLEVVPRRVIDKFLHTLSGATDWKRVFIVSPWISELASPVSLTLDGLVDRVQNDGAVVYVATRPPEETWHAAAIDKLKESGCANIVFVPNLHAKLFTAETASTSFAMLGSANMTQRSMLNHELGLMVSSFGEGHRFVRELGREAATIYRLPGRTQVCHADLTRRAR
ncbi:MAG: putative DNA binding domain-containing protein [Nocardioides sp.]